MKFCFIGCLGLIIFSLMLGFMFFGENSDCIILEVEAGCIMDKYFDVGGNYIDMVNVYVEGCFEEIIGCYFGGCC